MQRNFKPASIFGWVFLSVFLLSSGVESKAQHTIHGHVIDRHTSLPVSQAVVMVNGQEPVVTCTHGAFTVALPPGRHHIQVQHLNFFLYTDTLSVSGDAHVDIALGRRQVNLNVVTVATLREFQVGGMIAPVQVLPGPEQFTSDVNLHLGAMLRSVPGVSSVNTGASAGLPWIRGLGGNRIGVFVDGVPQQNQQWAVDHGTDIDPWMAEQIRVYKGPSTLIFGSNASAGVVAVDPAQPLRKNSLSVGAFARGQSVNDGYESGFRYRQRWNKLQLEARIIYRNYADYRVPAETFTHLNRVLPIYNKRLVNTSGESNAQQVRVRWIDGQHQLRAEYRRSDQLTGIFPGIFGIPTIPKLQGDGDPRTTALPSMTSLHETASFIYERRGELGELRLTAGWQHSTRQEMGPPHTHGNTPLPDSPLALELDMHAFFTSLHIDRKLDERRKIFTGFQIEHLDSRSSGWEFLVSDYTTSTAGVYAGVEGIAHFWGGRLDGGLRGDAALVQTDAFEAPVYDVNQNIVGANLLSGATDEAFPGLSGSLSWSRDYEDHHRLAVQFARTIRFPAAYELAANGVHHGTFRHEQGNPDLQTETGYQLDVRLTGYSGKLTWEVSPYAGYYDNFLYLGPSARFSHLPHAGQLYAFRQANVFRTGSELLVRYALRANVSVTATAEYLFAHNLDEGMALPWTPPFKSEVSANWQPFLNADNEFYLRGTFTGVSAQNLVDRNEPPTDGYALLTLALGGNAGGLQWAVFVNNVFNTRYIDHLSRYKLLNLPEPGRNAGVLLIYEFNQNRT